MSESSLLVLLGNQLFPNINIESLKPRKIFMAEDFELCTYEKHHKLKILMYLGAMREKRDELVDLGFDVEYQDIGSFNFKKPFESKLQDVLKKNDLTQIKMFEIEDKDFEQRLIKFSKDKKINLEFFPSPMFLINRSQFKAYKDESKKVQMGNFYKDVRKLSRLFKASVLVRGIQAFIIFPG